MSSPKSIIKNIEHKHRQRKNPILQNSEEFLAK